MYSNRLNSAKGQGGRDRASRTLELVEADGGVEHADGPRPLGEVAVVGVVQRRPHEIAHLRWEAPLSKQQPTGRSRSDQRGLDVYQNGLVAGDDARREQSHRGPPCRAPECGDGRQVRRRHAGGSVSLRRRRRFWNFPPKQK